MPSGVTVGALTRRRAHDILNELRAADGLRAAKYSDVIEQGIRERQIARINKYKI